MADEALNRLSAELEAGRSDTLKTYLAAMSRFRRYSWNNVLLIAAQRPHATQVAGIHAWNDLGRAVKKGEKGIMIVAPVIVKRETSPTEPEPKQPSRLASFRTAYLFDRDKTEGKPLPEFAKTTGDPRDFTAKLKALAASHGITVDYDPAIAPAQGVSSGGRIKLLPGLGTAEEFSTLAHELAHEMLHHGKEASALPKLVRETQAEAVAYVVIRHIYLDFDVDGTAAVDRLLKRRGVPKPNYLINTSPDKWQVVWKVEGFEKDHAEHLQRALARDAGADRAATDCTRFGCRASGITNMLSRIRAKRV